MRADRPGDLWETDYGDCRGKVEEGVYVAPVLNPSGTLGGAAAAGAARGVARSIEKYRLTAQCMRDRGYIATRVSADERKVLRGPASPERDKLVAEIAAREAAPR